MNSLFASGGYPWTIVRVEERDQYMGSLEAASVDGDVRPFARFIARQMSALGSAGGVPNTENGASG
jgi:hypothetical protein